MSDRVGKVRQGRSAAGGPEGPRKRSGQLRSVRRARDDDFHGDDLPVVAVTGAAHDLGLALTARLAQSERFSRVIAIDDQRGDLTGVIWRVVDIRDPALAGRLSGIDVIVHTDLDLAAGSDLKARRAHNVRGAQTVLTAAAAGGVGRVVLITSAMVYGAKPDNPVPIAESAPLGADPDGSVVGDFMEIEQLAERSPRTNPGMSITVVRPAALVGEGIDTLITRHFEAPRLLVVKGCAPRWQFCHVSDLLSAIEMAAAGEVKGAFAVGSDGWLDQDQVEELSGLRRIELPAGVTARSRVAADGDQHAVAAGPARAARRSPRRGRPPAGQEGRDDHGGGRDRRGDRHRCDCPPGSQAPS